MRTISVQAAVELIPDGASVMIGGFMGVGTPERLVDELVRQKKRDLTVIALSASAVPDDVAAARAAGAADYWTKPIDVGRFIERMRTLMPTPSRA